MHTRLLHNGTIRSTSDALLMPGQVGFMNGWGVFSTLRVAHGVLFAYERHYHRMERDAARMRVPFPFSPDELEAQLLLLVEANQAWDSTLRVALVRNSGNMFEAPRLPGPVDLIAFTADLRDWGTGVHLGYKPHTRYGLGVFAGTKYTAWAENLALHEAAHENGFDEYILLNESGEVSECTSANIFMLQGDRLWTPPLSSSGCLSGITRAIVLEELGEAGLECAERRITPAMLEQADTAFITSSTRDLLPIVKIETEPFSNTSSHFPRLQRAFAEYRQRYVESEIARRQTGAPIVQSRPADHQHVAAL